MPPELTEFVEEVLLANPACGLRTIRSSGAVEVLRDILGGVPTSHRALDRATQRRNGTASATEHL